jgi:hypothetical protein
MPEHHFEYEIIQTGRREWDQTENHLYRNVGDSPPRFTLAEPEAMLQCREEQSCHKQDEIDIRGDAYSFEAILGNHFIFDFLLGQADEKSGCDDYEIEDHGDEPAVVINQCEQVCFAEKLVENLVESRYQGNQEQNPPSGLLAGVGHENAFLVHGMYD